MFSGIVEESAQIIGLNPVDAGAHLIVDSLLDHTNTKLGDSILVDGVCLTLVKKEGSQLSFDLAEETLRKTALGSLKQGAKVNLERSLFTWLTCAWTFLFFGHVDTVAEVLTKKDEGNSVRLEFKLEKDLLKYLAPKGSVSVSGVSLTVGEVSESGFSVYIIPHTGDVTTLLTKNIGEEVNIEIDMLARYVHRMIDAANEDETPINKEFLKANGFINEKH